MTINSAFAFKNAILRMLTIKTVFKTRLKVSICVQKFLKLSLCCFAGCVAWGAVLEVYVILSFWAVFA